jgi:leader peptidase (prepilin peptidase)/N-methyltransferase
MILIGGKDVLVEFSIFMGGLILGSFFNMLIYRLPENISLVNPKRSMCPNCSYQIKWYENIPVLSYLFLRGKCSNCNIHISIVYPLVEIITGIVSLAVYYKVGLNLNFFIILTTFHLLIILSFIDFKYKAVPDYLLIIVLIVSAFILDFSFKNALLFTGSIVILELFITFYIQNIKYRITKNEELLDQRALGEGDIPIIALIGGILGIKLGIIAIVLGSILAILPSIYNLVRKQDMETPFIPFLSLGLFFVFVFEEIFERII